MRTEPSASIGASVSAVLAAAFLVLKASGVEVTQEMTTAVEALVWALVALPFVSGLLTRFFVVSPQTAANAVVMAKEDNAPTNEVPAIQGPAGAAYAAAVKDMQFVPKPPPAN